jgi:hypothetical protein
MAFTPDSPFPKSRGHVIKSKDWNDAITEVQRLDNAKVNKAGDGITGPLTIAGNVGVGTTSPTTGMSGGRALHVDNPTGGSVLRLGAGIANGQQWEWQSTVINNVGALNLSKLTAPASNPLTVLANGNVGIGTTTPGNRLEVNGDIAILAKHAIRGTDPWLRLNDSSAFTGGVYTRGLFAPDSLNVGGAGGWTNPGAGNVWVNGRVGIGATDPGFRLDVADRIRLRQGGSGTAGLWLFQSTPNRDQAFLGMRTDTTMGLWGNTGAGWGLFMDTGSGDVTITGRLGTNGFPPTPHTAGWGGGIRTWDLEVEATAWVRNGVQTGARDLAENFSSDMDLDPGDVVCMGYDEESVVLSEEPDDGLVLGVVSSRPGFLLNSDHDVDDGGTMFPVALCGRVPCKVVDENGPIRKGDLLTSSSTPGHAMRASSVMLDGQEIQRPGTIIGKAVGSLASGTGTIEVFVTTR